MKSSTPLFPLLLVCAIFTSCLNRNGEQQNFGEDGNFDDSYGEDVNYQNGNNETAQNASIKYFNTVDSRN
ncbi:MAG: hypothetical protein JJE55_07830 [Flavobacteriaceae bacterium]|nr:hypothetical protein [Flavobacteriaceae bacterium]